MRVSKTVCLAGGLLLGVGFVAGCGSGANSSGGSSKELSVAAFQGGYGIDAYEKAAQEFGEMHPGLKVKVEGDPRIWEKLRPRLVAGDPPDLMFPGWGMDHWSLVEEGQLMPLDEALDGPAWGGKGKWRDTFMPEILKLCQKDGKTWMLPYYYMIYGWWYDPGVFAKNGWTPPQTWNELLALCDKIKAKGIAPITFQGQYPYYMIEGMLLPWAVSIGGIEAVDAAQNLEPGAWNSPAMVRAAEMICELRDRGYFQDGATGMSHTESQTQFLNGKAAMLPCGSWLSSEMKDVMPPDAKIEFMMCPRVEGGKGDPTAILIGIEPWMIPKDAKNKEMAVELFKYMTSLEKAKEFVETKGTMMAIVGSEKAKLPEVLIKPAEAVNKSKTVWSVQYRMWYPAMQKEIEGAMTSMLNGEITAKQFCDRCEAAAAATRDDPNIPKYKLGS